MIYFGVINCKTSTKIMDKFLSMIENPRPETVIEEEKLIHFISKISVLDYLNIYESTYKSYSVEEKPRLLNKYYSELYEWYYGSGNFYFLLLFGLLLPGIFYWCLALLRLVFSCVW